MTIEIRFFSILRDFFKTGEKQISLDIPQSAKEIFLNLFEDKNQGERFLRVVRVAVNQEYVSHNTIVKDGDEIAFIPPVSGG